MVTSRRRSRSRYSTRKLVLVERNPRFLCIVEPKGRYHDSIERMEKLLMLAK